MLDVFVSIETKFFCKTEIVSSNEYNPAVYLLNWIFRIFTDITILKNVRGITSVLSDSKNKTCN